MENFEQNGVPAGLARHLKPWIMLVSVVLSLFLITKTVNEFRYPSGDETPPPTITVTGYGEAYAKPDIATVTFSVTEENLVVAKAQEASTKTMNAIIESLKTQGILEKDIKTTNYNIYPRYEYSRVSCTATYCPPADGKQILAAYVVTQSVMVKIRDLSKAGVILSSAGELGATDISGLSFGIDDDDAVKAVARDEAISKAEEKAKVMADALGVRLVKIVGFSEDGYYPQVYRTSVALDAYGKGGGEATIPNIQTGENLVTSNVSVTYEIR